MGKNSKPGEEKKNEEAYRKASKQVRAIMYKAKNDYRQEFVAELEREEAKGNLFGVVRLEEGPSE